jgi:hypothetical protein
MGEVQFKQIKKLEKSQVSILGGGDRSTTTAWDSRKSDHGVDVDHCSTPAVQQSGPVRSRSRSWHVRTTSSSPSESSKVQALSVRKAAPNNPPIRPLVGGRKKKAMKSCAAYVALREKLDQLK